MTRDGVWLWMGDRRGHERAVWVLLTVPPPVHIICTGVLGGVRDTYDFAQHVAHTQTYKGLKCCLHLPCTDWVLANSGLQEPQLSAKGVSDSTLIGLRVEVCHQLRLRR